MSDKTGKHSGLFSLSIQSIEWQVKNMFQDAGGDKAIELMDRLAGIPESEREFLLDKFLSAVSKIASGKTVDASAAGCEGSAAVNNPEIGIEEQIVNDVLAALESPKRLSVLNGGKIARRSVGRLIDFNAARKERSDRADSSLN